MKKIFIGLFLAIVMVVSMIIPASAADTTTEADQLRNMEIYLDMNFNFLFTDHTFFVFDYKITKNDDTSVFFYNYAVVAKLSEFEINQLKKNLSDEEKAEVEKLWKDNMREVASYVIDALPANSKIFGYYFYDWCDEPGNYDTYHSQTFYTWFNFPLRPAYFDTELPAIPAFTTSLADPNYTRLKEEHDALVHTRTAALLDRSFYWSPSIDSKLFP